jgi:hypothetical protein
MARKRRFRFGFDVFAGRPHHWRGRRWLVANSIAAVARISALGSVLFFASTSRKFASYEKARGRSPGAGA